MMKGIISIIGGFLVVFILSIATDFLLESVHIFPPINSVLAFDWKYLCMALIYRSVYAVIGGYVTALIAPKNKMKYVWILACIGFIFASLGLLANLDKPSLWYPIALVVLTLPSVWLGGKLREK